MDIGLRVRDAQTLERLAHHAERHRALTGGWPDARPGWTEALFRGSVPWFCSVVAGKRPGGLERLPP